MRFSRYARETHFIVLLGRKTRRRVAAQSAATHLRVLICPNANDYSYSLRNSCILKNYSVLVGADSAIFTTMKSHRAGLGI